MLDPPTSATELTPFPDSYEGPVNTAQAAQGIQRALTNATRLVAEATLLLKNQRRDSAAVLAIQSIEEAFKPKYLRTLLLARNDDELRESWKGYRQLDVRDFARYRIHFAMWGPGGGGGIDEDVAPLFGEQDEATRWLGALKQCGLSTDTGDRGDVSSPSSAIPARLAEKLFYFAKRIVPLLPSTMTSAPELDILVKHLRPIWKCTGYDLSKAVWACYLEAQDAGVLQGDISQWVLIRTELASS